MFVITIEGIDSSCHTQESDALVQKQRFIDAGKTTVEIVEKETFEPPVE